LQKLVYEERHEPFANLKDQIVITDTWHDVDIEPPESEKLYTCSSGKSV